SLAEGGPQGPPLRYSLLLRLQFHRRGLGELRRVDRNIGLNVGELQRHLHVGLRQGALERYLHAKAGQLAIIRVVDLRRHERNRCDRKPQQPDEQAVVVEEQLGDPVAVGSRLQDDDVLVVEDGAAAAPLRVGLAKTEREVRQGGQARAIDVAGRQRKQRERLL